MPAAQRHGFRVRLVGVLVTVIGLVVFAFGSETHVAGEVMIVYTASPINQLYWAPYRALGMIVIASGLAVFSWGVGYTRGLRRAGSDVSRGEELP